MTTDLLRPSLQRAHARWLEDVSAVLGAAQQPGAGTWARWTAVRYLQTTFLHRLEQERRMVRSVAAHLSEQQQTTLWALGELLDTLRAQLDHLVGLCHRAGEFASVAGKIQKALGYWCREVDEDLGPLAVEALPPGLRDEVEAGVALPEPAGV